MQLADAGLDQFRAALAAEVRKRAFALFTAQRRADATREVSGRGEELVATLVQREPAGVTPLLETRAIEASVIKLRRDASEAAQEAHKWAWFWGGSSGMAVGGVFVILASNTPTASTVDGFTATRLPDRVQLTWQTLNEMDLHGFHLYRGLDPAGPGERITGDPVPAQGASTRTPS